MEAKRALVRTGYRYGLVSRFLFCPLAYSSTWTSSAEALKGLDAPPKLADEMKKMEYEPLLPVEKKLIGWSIGLGVILLGLLVWASYTFLPAGAGH